MKKFEFQEKGHKYFLDDKPLTGVTTVLNVIAKPALIAWSAKMACEYVKANLKSLEELDQVLELAKIAHTRKKEDAGDIGKQVHKHIENWIKQRINPAAAYLEEITKQEADIVNNFIKWAIDNKIKFLESDVRFISTSITRTT